MSIRINDRSWKVVATIEARMASTRLPGKVMMPLCGEPAIGRLVERVRRCPLVDETVVATTETKTDDPMVDYCRQKDIRCYRGSEEDVLSRVLGAAGEADADLIVELTGDNILVDPEHIARIIKFHQEKPIDYAANFLKRTFPSGFEVQSFPLKVLAETDRLTQDPADREHVSTYIYNHPEKYRLFSWETAGELNWPHLAVTMDTQEDYRLIKAVFHALYPEKPRFTALDVIRHLKNNPELLEINHQIQRKKVPGQVYLS